MKKLISIDASALKSVACWRKFYLIVVKGLKPKGEGNYKMAYGTAFHKFLQGYYGGINIQHAAREALDYYKPHNDTIPSTYEEYRTLNHLALSIKEYVKTYPLATETIKPQVVNGQSQIESKFAFPYWNNANYDVMLCGTVDLRGTYNGQECLIDHKTTSYREDKFFDGYDMDVQTMFYSWFYKKYGGINKYLPVMVNGIFLKKPTIKEQKKGIFDGVQFKRSPLIEYNETLMGEFDHWVTSTLEEFCLRLEHDKESFYKNPQYSFCRSVYGLCSYFKLCSMPGQVRDNIENYYYEQKQYEPLNFGKE